MTVEEVKSVLMANEGKRVCVTYDDGVTEIRQYSGRR